MRDSMKKISKRIRIPEKVQNLIDWKEHKVKTVLLTVINLLRSLYSYWKCKHASLLWDLCFGTVFDFACDSAKVAVHLWVRPRGIVRMKSNISREGTVWTFLSSTKNCDKPSGVQKLSKIWAPDRRVSFEPLFQPVAPCVYFSQTSQIFVANLLTPWCALVCAVGVASVLSSLRVRKNPSENNSTDNNCRK